MKKFLKGFFRNFVLLLIAATGIRYYRLEQYGIVFICILAFLAVVGIFIFQKRNNQKP